jgi:nitrite reductase (cytochrome c-552)
MPNLNDKDVLQKYIGLDMPEELETKEKFLEEVIPHWIKEGKEREARTLSVKKVSSR